MIHEGGIRQRPGETSTKQRIWQRPAETNTKPAQSSETGESPAQNQHKTAKPAEASTKPAQKGETGLEEGRSFRAPPPRLMDISEGWLAMDILLYPWVSMLLGVLGRCLAMDILLFPKISLLLGVSGGVVGD